MEKIKDLLEKRNRLITAARAFLSTATAASRAMTAEEQKSYDDHFVEIKELNVKMDTIRENEEMERRMASMLAAAGGANPAAPAGGSDRSAEILQRDGFRSWLREAVGVRPRDADGLAAFRNLSEGVDVEGGYLVTPQEFINQLIQAIDDIALVRRFATVHRISGAASLGFPTLDSDPGDAEWTTELATGGEDDELAFGLRALTPHPMAKRIKVSKQLLRRSALPIEQIIRERFAYKFGITYEKGYMVGNGDQRPLGLFVASDQGIPAARDVKSGANDGITTDGLIDVRTKLKSQYRARARWFFSRELVGDLAKLKDGAGQFVWRFSMREGDPDILLGMPYHESEYVPSDKSAAGNYLGMLADFKYYWIADEENFQMQRLIELYAEKNQIGFIARAEGDGMPILAEAFSRIITGV